MTADDLQPGTIPHAAVRRLRLLAPNEELSTAELAEAVGQSSTVLIPAMQTARNHGIVSARKRYGGNGLWWSMGSGKEPQTASDDDELVQKPAAAEPPPITSRSVFDIARGASEPEMPPARDSQQVLKAEGSRPDATGRDVPATTSPGGGPTGAGQPAAAGPAGMRFALWSDGALEISRAHGDSLVISPEDTERLFDYLDVLRAKEVAA